MRNISGSDLCTGVQAELRQLQERIDEMQADLKFYREANTHLVGQNQDFREALAQLARWYDNLFDCAVAVHKDLYNTDLESPVGEAREEVCVRSIKALAPHIAVSKPLSYEAWDLLALPVDAED